VPPEEPLGGALRGIHQVDRLVARSPRIAEEGSARALEALPQLAGEPGDAVAQSLRQRSMPWAHDQEVRSAISTSAAGGCAARKAAQFVTRRFSSGERRSSAAASAMSPKA
jgi:hypothetical protein